jgi:nucleotide-binding universal stress UspA family protein
MRLLEEQFDTAVAIKNVLFATDFSEISDAALPYVTALSLRYGSTIHVAHVLPEVTFLRPGAPDPAVIGSIYEDAHSLAQERIQRISDRLSGFPHHTYVRHGRVLDVIDQLVREQEVDLIVLGTHGRTGLGKLVLGSIAEEIFRQAPCPVFTVGPRVHSLVNVHQARHDRALPPVQISFHNVLCATDLKKQRVEHFQHALSLAREFRARLTLLNVIEGFDEHLNDHPGAIDTALRQLESLVVGDTGLRYPPEVLAEYGSPAELILQTAEEKEADLIVLGAHPAPRHLTAATHFGGSTAHRVVVGANCPVLTVRG